MISGQRYGIAAMYQNNETWQVAGGQKGTVSRCSLSVSKLMGLVHSEIVEIVNFDSFGAS
jgi:hypothetical protein